MCHCFVILIHALVARFSPSVIATPDLLIHFKFTPSHIANVLIMLLLLLLHSFMLFNSNLQYNSLTPLLIVLRIYYNTSSLPAISSAPLILLIRKMFVDYIKHKLPTNVQNTISKRQIVKHQGYRLIMRC